MSSAPPATSQAAVVQLDGISVTMESIDQLTQRRDSLLARSKADDAEAARLVGEAAQKFRQAGSFLVVQRSAWDTTSTAPQLATVDSLTTAIDEVDRNIAEISQVQRKGLAGFFKRFGDRQRLRAFSKQRNDLADKVGTSLQELAQSAPARTVPDADPILVTARAASAQATSLRQESDHLEEMAKPITEELGRRNESIKNMGFDALWTAAWLRDNAPAAVQSPLILKAGEVAWISVPARLSRQATRTRWEGSSQGFSFPIGHTGIRYRVGSYRGRPIETTVIKPIDSGTLVLTNQRLAFVGSAKSVVVGLQHVVHVECYTDALAVFQDKRETPDLLHVDSPRYVLFYINYAIGRLT